MGGVGFLKRFGGSGGGGGEGERGRAGAVPLLELAFGFIMFRRG